MPAVFSRSRRQKDETPATPGRPIIDGIAVDRLPQVYAEVRRGERRRVTTVGEEVLARPCREVTEFGGPALAKLIDDMHATMASCNGVGLAANQIGVDLRVFVFDCEDEDEVRHVGHVINPVLDNPRGGKDTDDEGCLSVPGPVADVTRAREVTVRGVDRFGRPVVIEGTGLLARCLQHECDHLDGKLYLDHLGGRDRKRVLRSLEQLRDETYAMWDAKAAELGKPAGADLDPEPPVVDDSAAGRSVPDETAAVDEGILGYDPAAYAQPAADAPGADESQQR